MPHEPGHPVPHDGYEELGEAEMIERIEGMVAIGATPDWPVLRDLEKRHHAGGRPQVLAALASAEERTLTSRVIAARNQLEGDA